MRKILAVLLFLIAAAWLIDARWRGSIRTNWSICTRRARFRGAKSRIATSSSTTRPGCIISFSPSCGRRAMICPRFGWAAFSWVSIGLATLAVTGLIARRTAGRTAAWAAPTLLLCTTIFFGKAIEIRPDVPAALLLTSAAYVLLARRRVSPGLAALLAGILMGAATLFTQKAIVPAAAMIAAQAVLAGRSERLSSRLRTAAWAAAGLAVTWAIAAGMFWAAGGATAFWRSTVYQLWRWPVRSSPLSALRPTVLADLPIWIGAAVSIGLSLIVGRRCRRHRRQRLFLASTVVFSFPRRIGHSGGVFTILSLVVSTGRGHCRRYAYPLGKRRSDGGICAGRFSLRYWRSSSPSGCSPPVPSISVRPVRCRISRGLVHRCRSEYRSAVPWRFWRLPR